MGTQAPLFPTQLLILLFVSNAELASVGNGLNPLHVLQLQLIKQYFQQLGGPHVNPPPIEPFPEKQFAANSNNNNPTSLSQHIKPPVSSGRWQSPVDLQPPYSKSNSQPATDQQSFVSDPSLIDEKEREQEGLRVQMPYYPTNRELQSPVDPRLFIFRSKNAQENPGISSSLDGSAQETDPQAVDPRLFIFRRNNEQQIPGISSSLDRSAQESDSQAVDPRLFIFRRNNDQQNPGVPLSFDRTAWGTDPPPVDDARSMNPDSRSKLSFDLRPTQPSIGLQPPNYRTNIEPQSPIDPRLFIFRRNQPGVSQMNSESLNPQYRTLFDEQQKRRRKERARSNPWGTSSWRKQLFDKDPGPPPDNPYENQQLPLSILPGGQYGQIPMNQGGSNPARRTAQRSDSDSNDKNSPLPESNNWTDGLWQMLLLNLLQSQAAA